MTVSRFPISSEIFSASAYGIFITITFAMPYVINCSSIRSSPCRVSVVPGKYADIAFSTFTQFIDTTEKIRAMPNNKKNKFRLSTMKVATFTINPPSSLPLFGCAAILSPSLSEHAGTEVCVSFCGCLRRILLRVKTELPCKNRTHPFVFLSG